MNEPTNKTALVLPGGGARGAYQVGVIKGILELLGQPRNPFPVICGTSAGAINAAVMASYASDPQQGLKRLEYFWSNLTCDRIYRTDQWTITKTMARSIAAMLFGRCGVSAPRSLLDSAPLEGLLEREMHLHQLPAAIEAGDLDALCINASAYSTARAISFYQAQASQQPWSRNRRAGVSATLSVDHILASAALPFLFPARRLGQQFYGDGGIRMNAPLSPAIHLGANRLLIIGTRDETPIPEPAKLPDYPAAGELGGYLLDTIFMDTTRADLSRLQRINETLALIPEGQRSASNLRCIEALEIKPSQDLSAVTAEHAENIPRSVRTLLKVIGGWGKDWRMPSYLLFEREYTTCLIDLGYQDAMAQADEIITFMT